MEDTEAEVRLEAKNFFFFFFGGSLDVTVDDSKQVVTYIVRVTGTTTVDKYVVVSGVSHRWSAHEYSVIV